MLRAVFIAVGTFVALTGLLLFRVDRIVLTATPEHTNPTASAALEAFSKRLPDGCREVDPPAWLPYTLASTGLLTILYALALPRKGT
jgi:hypothetical protein